MYAVLDTYLVSVSIKRTVRCCERLETPLGNFADKRFSSFTPREIWQIVRLERQHG